MNRIVVDAYAWIEYFRDTDLGRRFAQFMNDTRNELLCSSFTVAEISSKIVRMGRIPDDVYTSIASMAAMAEVSPEDGLEIGKIHGAQRKEIRDFPIADAAILHLARKTNAKILTGDPHFKRMKEAIFIGKS